jgi:hypothetical protein
MLLLEMSPGPRLGGIVRRALGCFKSLQIIEVRGGRLGARDARLLKQVSPAEGWRERGRLLRWLLEASVGCVAAGNRGRQGGRRDLRLLQAAASLNLPAWPALEAGSSVAAVAGRDATGCSLLTP